MKEVSIKMECIRAEKKLWKCPICERYFGDFETFMYHTHTMKEIGDNLHKLTAEKGGE